VGQGAVDQVGEDGFDDRVLAVGDVRLGGGQVGVGEERVYRQTGNRASRNLASLTRRTTRRAVNRSLVDANAV
jgi:hypothetical protein